MSEDIETQNLLNKLELKAKFMEMKDNVQQQLKSFQNELSESENAQKAKDIIKLNVGGKVFLTTRTTLTSEPNTFFSGMFSGNFDETPDEKGEYFIDRNPKFFDLILDHLRGVNVRPILEEFSDAQLHSFIEEVNFYQIQSLFEDDWKIIDSELITVSDEGSTATRNEKTPTNPTAIVFGSKDFVKGNHVWEIKVNSINFKDENSAFVVGIVERQQENIHFFCFSRTYVSICKSNKPYTKMPASLESGDVLRMELDLEKGEFNLIQKKPGGISYCIDIDKKLQWNPGFILPTAGDSFTLIMRQSQRFSI